MYAEIDTDDNKIISLQEFLEYYCQPGEVSAQKHLNKSENLRISDSIRDVKANGHSLSAQTELAGPNNIALEQMKEDFDRLKAQHAALLQECKTLEQPQVSHTAGADARTGAVAARIQLLAPFGGGSVQRRTSPSSSPYSGSGNSGEHAQKRTAGTACEQAPQPVRGSWRGSGFRVRV
jgi:hypothetical protein